MRSTLHVLAAEDYLALRPLFAPVTRASFLAGFRREMAGIDLDELGAAAHAVAAAEPTGMAAIGRALAPRWPDVDPRVLGYAAGATAPLVQIPPRGLWRDNRRPKLVPAEPYLGAPLAADPDAGALVLRYLAAFGPASPADLRAWSGLTGAAAILERLAPQLERVRDDAGRVLYDVPGAPRPDPGTPAPVRYLPVFDNAILAHDDRSRILADGYPPRIADHPTVLVDGFAAGTWRIADGILDVTLFAPVGDTRELEEEGERLLAFAADAPARGVRVTRA